MAGGRLRTPVESRRPGGGPGFASDPLPPVRPFGAQGGHHPASHREPDENAVRLPEREPDGGQEWSGGLGVAEAHEHPMLLPQLKQR